MSSPNPTFSKRSDFSRRAASALAVCVLLLAGCSATSRSNSEWLTQAAPQPTTVASGSAMAAAEQEAALHEGDFVLTGAGNSMLPLYRPGTAVVVHPTSFFMLKSGMPVVYTNRQGTPVAHVLLEKCAGGWLAMGINNAEPDEDIVTPQNLVGIVRCAFVASAPPGRSGAVASLVSFRNNRFPNEFAALTW